MVPHSPGRLRILHVIHSANLGGGGPVEGIRQLSHVNLEAGHSVEVASLDAPGAPFLQELGLPVHALGPGRGRYGFTPALVPWLRGRRDHYDAVIVNGIWNYNSLGVWRALRKTTTPYFVFPHGMLDPWFKRAYPLKHLKKWLYWPWAEYRVLRDARAVLFTCEAERRLARQSFWLYRCHERVVNYGTAAPTGEPAANRESFLRKLPHLRAQRIFLYLGRLHKKKGVDLLLHAFSRLVSAAGQSLPGDRRPLHLVIAGPCSDPTYLRTLKHQATDRGQVTANQITFTGMLTGELKWGAFQAAEVFLLPSHQENFGIAVVEALACGLPVLISDQVNIWREIEQDGAGLVAADNLPATLDLLQRWSRLSAGEQGRMRQRARECFARRFEIHRAAGSLIRTLRACGIET